MYCTKKVTDDLIWVGGNDRRLAMFEGVYSVPDGVSYNSYLLLDDTTVLFDTVDHAVSKVFFENLEHALAGRQLNYLIVQHMEPDHSATMAEVCLLYTSLFSRNTTTSSKSYMTGFTQRARPRLRRHGGRRRPRITKAFCGRSGI